MAPLFDTHAHFEGPAEEISAALERARAAGVERILAVGGSESLDAGAALAKSLAGGIEVDVAFGRDRDQYAREWTPPAVEPAAVGEIGLDYHYDPGHAKEQRELFSRQLEYASASGKPVVIHTRDADDDTLGILREIPSKGVIHCFTGTPRFCRALLDLGFMVSFSGIVTFRAADNVRESALVVPDDRILIETDSPFLAPVPMRGRTNEPAFIVHTAKFLAKLRGTEFEDFARLTFSNGVSLFGSGGSGS